MATRIDRAAVKEVAEFVMQGNLLSASFNPEAFTDYPVYIIKNCKNLDRFRDCMTPGALIGDMLLWQGILDNDVDEFYKTSAERGEAMLLEASRLVDNTVENLERLLRHQLRSKLPREQISEIASMLNAIMLCRALGGMSHLWPEKMYRALRAYGYPCGWVGDFDETGKLVVFSI